jgi:hypothetical protein
MKKLGCASCGGTKKMAKGGTTKNVNISKPTKGVKSPEGGSNGKMGIYGIPQTGPTGPNDSGIATMKKGGVVKKPLVKAQSGTSVGEMYKRKSTMQNYLDVNKNKGAVPSDTLGKTSSTDSRMGYYSSANPKNQKALNKAVKTRDTEASKALDEKFTRRKNESNATYTKRVSMKTGGVVKSKKK